MGAYLQAAGTYTAGTAAPVPPIPAGATAGDIMVLLCESSNAAIVNDAALKSAGWAEITGSPQGTGSGTAATRLTGYWKRHDGSETNPNLGDSGDHTGGTVLLYRGCISSGNPINDSAGSVAASASTAVGFPGITTTVDDCLVVNAVAWSTDTASAQASGWDNDDLLGLTEVIDAGSTAGNGGGISVAQGLKESAGAVASTSATLATSSVQGRLTFGLIPEPVPDGDVTLTAVESGSNFAQGAAWASLSYSGNDDGESTRWTDWQKAGNYTVDTGYVVFSGAALAGGSPVSAAKLRLYVTTRNDGDAKYDLSAEYYDFQGASDSGDFVKRVTTHAVVPKRLNTISTNAYCELDVDPAMLSGITKGRIGFRLTLWSATDPDPPAGSNGITWQSHANTNKPQLVVTLTADEDTTEVTRTIRTSWRTRAAVTRTRATWWHTRANVILTRGTGWHVRTAVDTTRTTGWRVRGHATRLASTSWRVRRAVAATRCTSWMVRATVPVTRSTSWQTRGLAATACSTRWHTRGTVTASTSTSWHTWGTASAGWSTSWRVRGAVTRTVRTGWRVLPPHGVVIVLRSTRWHTRAQVTTTRATGWSVRRAVDPVARTTRWAVRATATRTTSTWWRTRATARTTRATRWQVRAAIHVTRKTRWRVLGEYIPIPGTSVRCTTWIIPTATATATASLETMASTWVHPTTAGEATHD